MDMLYKEPEVSNQNGYVKLPEVNIPHSSTLKTK